jgi:protocatechuate 3,4-dioxygenase beta subunit
MQNLSEANITEAVIRTFDGTQNARLKEIMTSLVKHLHAFVRDVNLTEAEWLAGIQFLTATGQMCDERRQEFILLSDTLGVSTLKDLINNRKPEGMTEWSILGPFYRAGAHDMALGDNIAQNVTGEPVMVSGRVLSPSGAPLANALLDVWQSDAEGFYDLQKMDAAHMDLRGRFRTNEEGEYYFRTIRPSFYPIPDDGPVGKMLRAAGRHPYRPAHIHFQVSADGYKMLTTELYLNRDPYLDSDVVFGVRSSLVIDLEKKEPPDGAPFYAARYDFVMEPQ